MIQVLAPKMPRGWSLVWLWLALATAMTSSVPAQDGRPVPNPDAAKAAADAKPPDEAPPAANGDKPARPPQEIFQDPRSKQALAIFNPLPYPSPSLRVMGNPNDRDTIRNMAAGSIAPNPDLIKRYVEYFAAELSKKDNLNAFINPQPNTPANAVRAIDRAVTDLITPITVAQANNNPGNFLGIYARQLFDSSFIKLLDNNLIARIEAVIVLGMVGSSVPKDLDLYINQINNPDQVMWVKQWAARGLTAATKDGKAVLDATKTTQAVEALTKFLAGDAKTMPWPVQMRALEAMASLRTAVSTTSRGRIDAASVVMPYLIDPEGRPEVRAWAARALGWMTVPTTVRGYNFALLGDAIGRLAADLGDRIVAEYDRNADDFTNRSDEAALLTGFLLFQTFGAIGGEPGVKEAGLPQMTHPDARAQSSYFKELSDRIQAEAKQAVDLLRSGGADQKGQRDKLAERVKELREFLATKPPKDRRLVPPDGPEFPAPPAQVAGAKAP
ncbi:hypothetical protein TA3x_003844 [Tundrisphaera sp. TA3]|uniref:hypothetical protein n=1 Tax=Tundrisphaera sp. TA3 TaxID=3435775 RepID=UPI003EBF2904